MKNILVATDFSNNAYCALFYAAKLLATEPCTFHLLNVFNENTPLHGRKPKLFGGKKHFEELRTASKEKLTSTSHRIVMDNENPKHKFKKISKKGVVSKVIAKLIDENQIDLVVMGNKGLTEAADIFFGSNTIKTVEQIKKCSILAIPGQIDFTPPK
ncbi:MAG: universal stress protein, partial [Maribacter sp.]